MQESLMQQGAELMLYGMGTVFVFLTLLVIITSGMSALLQRFAKPAAIPSARIVEPTDVPDDQSLIAAITAAIHKHRSRHK